MANPKRKIESYYTSEYKMKQSIKVDRQFGPVEKHTKTCNRCAAEYIFTGRKHTKLYEKSRFCSRSCANHRGSGLEWANTHKERSLTHYRTLCFMNWERSCAICGFDKIVAVHHIDENHQNNDIRNLIPLCPNHHHMVHSNEWKNETKTIIDQLIKQKWGCSSIG